MKKFYKTLQSLVVKLQSYQFGDFNIRTFMA